MDRKQKNKRKANRKQQQRYRVRTQRKPADGERLGEAAAVKRETENAEHGERGTDY